MYHSRVERSKLFSVVLIAVLTIVLSGWTCSAMFVSCQGVGSQPQINSLSSKSVSSFAGPVALIVRGTGFTAQSQIMWNGSPLQTTLMDAHHLQTTITQETFELFGGTPGSTVEISVASMKSTDGSGCPIGGNSDPMGLLIE